MKYTKLALLGIFLGFTCPVAFAADNNGNEAQVKEINKDTIKITHNDQSYELTRDQLKLSITIGNMINDADVSLVDAVKAYVQDAKFIPALLQLPSVKKIHTVSESQKQDERDALTKNLDELSTEDLVQMMGAANYLDIEELVDACAQLLAQRLNHNEVAFLKPFKKLPHELQVMITRQMLRRGKTYSDIDELYQQCSPKYMTKDITIHNKYTNQDNTKIIEFSCFKTEVGVWDIQTDECLQTLTGHTDGINSAQFSPDDTKILSVSVDKTARLWDAATGQCLLVWDKGVDSGQFSPDGTKIVTVTVSDFTTRIWDIKTGESICVLYDKDAEKFHFGESFVSPSLGFSLDGTTIIIKDEEVHMTHWDFKQIITLHERLNNLTIEEAKTLLLLTKRPVFDKDPEDPLKKKIETMQKYKQYKSLPQELQKYFKVSEIAQELFAMLNKKDKQIKELQQQVAALRSALDNQNKRKNEKPGEASNLEKTKKRKGS